MENKQNDVGKAYRKALVTPPPAASMAYHTAQKHINAGEYKKAIGYLLKTEKLFPEYPTLYINIGAVCSELKKYDEALAAYQKAFELEDESASLLFGLAMAYTEIADANHAEGLKYYQRAAELDPKNDMILFGIGLAYTNLGDYEKCVENYLKVYALNPRFPEIEYRIGLAYKENKQYEEAIPYLQKAIKRDPNDVEVLCCIGTTYGELKQYDQAMMYLQQAADRKPDYWNSYYLKGLFYMNMGKNKQGLACLKHAFELHSTYDRVPWEIARCCWRLNNRLDFLIYSCKAIALGNKDAKAFTHNLEAVAEYRRLRAPIAREGFKERLLEEIPDFLTIEDSVLNDLIELVFNTEKYGITIAAYTDPDE